MLWLGEVSIDLVSQTVSVLLILTHVFGTDRMYRNFAGRDASHGMAKQSFDKGKCTFRILIHTV
jgi:hypothetical protein